MSAVEEFTGRVVLGVATTLISSAVIITVTKIATKMSFGQMANGVVKAILFVKDVVVEIANFFLDRLSG